MIYRTKPGNNEPLSLLGFGAMRLPTLADHPGIVDEEQSTRLIRHAIDNGVNYIDSAYTYFEGGSEEAIAKALRDGYGERVNVATKLPSMRLRDASEHDEYLETSLRRLERSQIDYYLLHGMKERYWPVIQSCKTIDFLEKKRSEGLIRNIGFSYHGESFELFREILDAGSWDFVQIQFNYMDEHIQAGVKGLQYAASKGLPVIIMEPLKGGKLAAGFPPAIDALWQKFRVKRSPAEWGLRWVASHPEVSVILSGMNKMEQVEENLAALSGTDTDWITQGDKAVIGEISAEYAKLIKYPCTGCAYCRAGCPQSIDIPLCISIVNEGAMFNNQGHAAFEINHYMRQPPSTCVECGQCEDVCPQHLHIIDIMKEIATEYEDIAQQWWREYV